MNIGKYKLHSLNTGTFGLDGGAMFGVIPKPLWTKSVDSDELNRITLGAKCLLLESDDRKILIDTGMGSNWSEKFQKIYSIDQSNCTLSKSLLEVGINSSEITDVILTHLHFDHSGGAVKLDGNLLVPVFSNAKYWIQKKHFDWAIDSSEKDRGSFIQDKFLPIHDAGLFNFIDGSTKIDDEIELLLSDGHTFSQQLVKISDSNKTVFHCGDLIPTAAHVPIPYVMGYDLQPLITIKEKNKYLMKAVEEEWILFFEHDPIVTGATVEKSDKGFVINKKLLEF